MVRDLIVLNDYNRDTAHRLTERAESEPLLASALEADREAASPHQSDIYVHARAIFSRARRPRSRAAAIF